MANVQAGYVDTTSVTEITVPRFIAASSTLQDGDVLMTEGGDLDKLGRGTLWRNELDGCLHQNHVFALRPLPSKLDARYLVLTTQSLYARHYFESTGVKTTNLASTNKSKILDFPIPVPPVEEQRRIADFLDAETARIDQMIELRRKQSALLHERWRARLSDAASGLIGRYGVIPLRYVLLSVEQGWSPQCDDRRAEPEEWGVVKAGCVNGGVFREDQHKALPVEVEPRIGYQLKSGDLLMSRASGSLDLIGSVAVVPEVNRKLLLCDKVYRLKVDSRSVRTEFVAHMLRTPAVRECIKLGVSGAEGMANNLPSSVIRGCEIPNAPLNDQDLTVVALDAGMAKLEETQTALERQVGLLNERRRAVVTATVTGELDVTTARRGSFM